MLYAQLKKHLTEETYIHADETPLQVLHEPGKSAQSKSYMWLFATNHTAPHRIVLYHYAPSRSGKVPKAFLNDYHGVLQCDGYDAYNKVEDVLRMGCLAHVRRKFALPREKSGKKPTSGKSLTYILDKLRGKTEGDLTCEELEALLPWSDQIPESCKMEAGEEELFEEEISEE